MSTLCNVSTSIPTRSLCVLCCRVVTALKGYVKLEEFLQVWQVSTVFSSVHTCYILYVCMYLCVRNTYHIRFNFRGVKLSRIADFSNFRVFIFADAGS